MYVSWFYSVMILPGEGRALSYTHPVFTEQRHRQPSPSLLTEPATDNYLHPALISPSQ